MCVVVVARALESHWLSISYPFRSPSRPSLHYIRLIEGPSVLNGFDGLIFCSRNPYRNFLRYLQMHVLLHVLKAWALLIHVTSVWV